MAQKLLETFAISVTEILAMKCSDFIKRYRDLLPKFEFVHEDDSVSHVFSLMSEGKDYIVVIDSHGRLRGVITYLDVLMHIGRKEHRILTTPLSSIVSSLKRSRIPAEILSDLKVSLLMKTLPPIVESNSEVLEALDAMERADTHYTLVLTPDGAVLGVITAHAIFRAAMRESVKKR